MSQMIYGIQQRIKTSSSGIGLIGIRLFVGYVVALTGALITQQMIGYADFAFYLFIVAGMMVFMRVSRGWGYGGVFIFSLISILIGLLLDMYIQIAPGI